MSSVVATVIDVLRNWFGGGRGREDQRANQRPLQNGEHRHNNNGLCAFSRKRKCEPLDSYQSDSSLTPSAKYRKVIKSMLQGKKNEKSHLSNGRGAATGTKKQVNLFKGEGVEWTNNPGHAYKPFSVKLTPLMQSHETHKKVEALFDEWDSFNEDFTATYNSHKATVVKTPMPKQVMPTQRKAGLSGVSATLSKPSTIGSFKPLGSNVMALPKMHLPIYSTRTYENPNRLKKTPLSKNFELITLDSDEQDIIPIESQPKIFTSTPAQRTSTAVWYQPSLLLRSISSINSNSSPSQESKVSKSEEEDDDLQIISETIISPKHDPFRTNSLELETRNSIYRQKSWLESSIGTFHQNRKFREDKIDYEAKKLAVLRNRSTLQSDLEARIRSSLTLTDIIVLEPEEEKLPPITPEMREFIDLTVRGRESEVVVTAFNIPITKGDLKTLAPCQWLNDNIINTYMDMIAQRSKTDTQLPLVHVFTTFFYPKYLKEGYSSILKRWTRKVDIFSMELIIFPIHLGIHWCLAVADLRNKTIKFYDSLQGNQSRCLEALMTYLTSEHKERKKSDLRSSEWKLTLEKSIPTQENGSDCGVFTCKFAEYLSRDADLTFKQKDMNYYRDRMIYEIVKQELISS